MSEIREAWSTPEQYKSCGDSGHKMSRGILGRRCIPCALYELDSLRAALQERVKELEANPLVCDSCGRKGSETFQSAHARLTADLARVTGGREAERARAKGMDDLLTWFREKMEAIYLRDSNNDDTRICFKDALEQLVEKYAALSPSPAKEVGPGDDMAPDLIAVVSRAVTEADKTWGGVRFACLAYAAIEAVQSWRLKHMQSLRAAVTRLKDAEKRLDEPAVEKPCEWCARRKMAMGLSYEPCPDHPAVAPVESLPDDGEPCRWCGKFKSDHFFSNDQCRTNEPWRYEPK